MKKKLLYSLLFGMFAVPSVFGADYGLPSGIQQGNILHCFNWPAKDVKAALPQIAAAGFGSVQLSPLQRPDAKVGENWHALYRPYDLAFKTSSFCSEQDLKDLCAEAEKYGIKIIVDVVANHVDKSAGYHDTWWDSNGRQRDNGAINYGDRYSITHGNLGDYKDINSENSEVIARGKAYVEKLKSLGVKGIRWDAAKHIGLPSEGCQFWAQVTSVSGMWHYGEILDKPGPNESIIKEYGQYMSVTDNEYSNYAARSNGGVPGGYGGSWAVNHGLGDKVVYWGESHDTYGNDEWSQNVDQATIDRAYAAYACRNGATALYLSRPQVKGFNNIKVGKGTTAFTAKHIAEVNKFRNLMVGKADWCEAGNNTFTVTRQGGGAVIVMKGSGNVTVKNGGGYCPAGTYTDRVSGGTFTVTASEIKGNVGSSGIAVLVKDGVTPVDPDPPTPPTPPTPEGSMWILGNIEGSHWTPNNGAEMTLTDGKYVAKGVTMALPDKKATMCYFNITDALGETATDWDGLNEKANRYGAATEGSPITVGTPAAVTLYANNVDAMGCLSWTIAPGTYDFTFDLAGMTLTVVSAGDTPNPPTPPTPPITDVLTITGDYNLAYNGPLEKVYWWPGCPAAYPGVKMDVVKGSDGNSYKVAKVTGNPLGLLFATLGDPDKTADLEYTGEYVMDNNGATSTAVKFVGGDTPNPPTPPVTGGDHYIYFDGTSFTQPMVYAWVDDDNIISSTWGGDNMIRKDNKWYWEVPSGKAVPKMVIIHEGDNKIGNGDLVYVDKATYHQDGTYSMGSEPGPNPPTPEGSMWILGNIEGAQWTTTKGAELVGNGTTYTAKGVTLSLPDDEATLCYFNITDALGADWDELNDKANRYGAATEGEAITLNTPSTVVKYANQVSAMGCLSWTIAPGTYDFTLDLAAMTLTVVNAGDNPPVPTKPVVTASPASGTVFTDDAIYVTLTVNPEATIYYSLNGTATASSTVYDGPIAISETTTLSTYAVTADGASNTQSFSYTKKNGNDPNPPTPPAGKNLITDYYKVNPNGRTGSNRTMTMSFTGEKSNTALSNWSDDDLIAQGVARDVCQAFRGVHERPIVDSYALYAAYDHDNLYLGVQYVYTIWDIGGEGKQPGESKPYNMDGKLCLAFDLDPAKSAKGITNENSSIWQNDIYTTFDNGADAWWYGSTKPGVGTPGFFVPNAEGICVYSDPNSCKPSTVKYGYADGLLPSIGAVYGQDDFSYDPELLKGNTGFVDLRSEIDDSAHTFYEYTIPLSLLGVTEDYIKNTGIGVMVVDFYGSSAHSSLPYDPCFYDKVFEPYSQEPSSSAEKEDQNEITYGFARVGKMGTSTVELPCVDETVADAEPVYFTLQGVRVQNPSTGLYIVVRGNKVTKEYIR